MSDSNCIVGVIGGLGNEAMVDMAEKIALSPAHALRQWIFFGNSRLAYKPHEVGLAPSALVDTEKRRWSTALHTTALMRYLGCGLTGLACNSAHELFREILLDNPVPFVDMILETAKSISQAQTPILLLGVTSLVESGLYQRALSEHGLNAVIPSYDNQKKVMSAIYDTQFGIKTGKITTQTEELLCDVLTEEQRKQGCQQAVLACTELPLALEPSRCSRLKSHGLIPEDMEIIDASTVLAQALVETPCAMEASSDTALPPLPDSHTDWFLPATFNVDSIAAMVDIQRAVFQLTDAYLAKQGRSVTGSYIHLPTLFLVGDIPHADERLARLGVTALSPQEPLADAVDALLQTHFTGMTLNK